MEVVNKELYDDTFEESTGSMITIYFRFDHGYNIYNRQIYSVMDLLRDVGGMFNSLYTIGLTVVTFLSHRLFISAILKHLYQIKDFKRRAKIEQRRRSMGMFAKLRSKMSRTGAGQSVNRTHKYPELP